MFCTSKVEVHLDKMNLFCHYILLHSVTLSLLGSPVCRSAFAFSSYLNPVNSSAQWILCQLLTFMGACNALRSTIQKLYHLRNAPKELGELDLDISALKSCVENVNQLVQIKSGDWNRTINSTSLDCAWRMPARKSSKHRNFSNIAC